MIGMPFSVQAGLVGTGEAASAIQAQGARDGVLRVLERADIQQQLQSLGLSPQAAKDRVNALTDQEISQLAGRINAVPAGADGAGILLIILIVALVWWLWK
jgi:shikimate 5-dehydrogenase